jgi:hypothetical protein
MKPLLIAVLVGIAITLAGCDSGAGSASPENPSQAATPEKSYTPEQALAYLDLPASPAHPLPRQDDPRVIAYRALLDRVSEKFGTLSRHDVADGVSRCQAVLEEKGIKVLTIDILAGVNAASPSGLSENDFKTVLAMYATERVNGDDHVTTIRALKAYLAVSAKIR